MTSSMSAVDGASLLSTSSSPSSSSQIASTSAVTLDQPIKVEERNEDAQLFATLVNGIQNGVSAAATATGGNMPTAPASVHTGDGTGIKANQEAEGPSGPIQAYAKLEFPGFSYYIQTLDFTIGRRPTAFRAQTSDEQHITGASKLVGDVDVDLGPLKSISRFHVRIFYQEQPLMAAQRHDLHTSTNLPSESSSMQQYNPIRSTSIPSSARGSSHETDERHSMAAVNNRQMSSYTQGRFVLQVMGRNGACVDDVYLGMGAMMPLGKRTKIQIAERVFYFVLPPSHSHAQLDGSDMANDGVDGVSMASLGSSDDEDDGSSDEDDDMSSGSLGGSSSEASEGEGIVKSNIPKKSRTIEASKQLAEMASIANRKRKRGEPLDEEEKKALKVGTPIGVEALDLLRRKKKNKKSNDAQSSLGGTFLSSTTAAAGHGSAMAKSNGGPANMSRVGSQSSSSSSEGSSLPPEGPGIKPNKTDLELLREALSGPLASSRGGKLTLEEIYSYLTTTYEWFRTNGRENRRDWRTSIRHTISNQQTMVRIERKPEEPGQGVFLAFGTSDAAVAARSERGAPLDAPGLLLSPSMVPMTNPQLQPYMPGAMMGMPMSMAMGMPLNVPMNMSMNMNMGMQMPMPMSSVPTSMPASMSMPMPMPMSMSMPMSIPGQMPTPMSMSMPMHMPVPLPTSMPASGLASQAASLSTPTPMPNSMPASPMVPGRPPLPATAASASPSAPQRTPLKTPTKAQAKSTISTPSQTTLQTAPASATGLSSAPSAISVRPPATPQAKAIETVAAKQQTATPASSATASASPAPRSAAGSPAITPDGRVSIVVGKAPAEALAQMAAAPKAAITQSIEALFGGPPIVHHEGTLFLSPIVFGKMSAQEINDIGGKGAQQALATLQAQLVAHLQSKMAGMGSPPPQQQHSQSPAPSAVAGATGRPPIRPRPGRPPLANSPPPRPPTTTTAASSNSSNTLGTTPRPALARPYVPGSSTGVPPRPQAATAGTAGRLPASVTGARPVGRPPLNKTSARPAGVVGQAAGALARPAGIGRPGRPPLQRPAQPPSATIVRPGATMIGRPTPRPGTTAATSTGTPVNSSIARPAGATSTPALPRPTGAPGASNGAGDAAKPLSAASVGPRPGTTPGRPPLNSQRPMTQAPTKLGVGRPPLSARPRPTAPPPGQQSARPTTLQARPAASDGTSAMRPPVASASTTSRPAPVSSSTPASDVTAARTATSAGDSRAAPSATSIPAQQLTGESSSTTAGSSGSSATAPAAATAGANSTFSTDMAELLALLTSGKLDSNKMTPAQHELLQRAGRLAAEQQQRALQQKAATSAAPSASASAAPAAAASPSLPSPSLPQKSTSTLASAAESTKVIDRPSVEGASSATDATPAKSTKPAAEVVGHEEQGSKAEAAVKTSVSSTNNATASNDAERTK